MLGRQDERNIDYDWLVGTAIWRTDEECICGESKFLKNKKKRKFVS